MIRHSGSLSAVLALLLVTILITMSHHAEARYLPTRSDPLAAPAGPPRGEDPRFDHLYDILKEVVKCSLLLSVFLILVVPYLPAGAIKSIKQV